LQLLAPDLSMVGCLAGPRAGALTHNLVHHKAVPVTVYVLGVWVDSLVLQFAGLIMLAHSSIDRLLGYGSKYPDAFSTPTRVMGKTPAVEAAHA
jgi:hypothetical protein